MSHHHQQPQRARSPPIKREKKTRQSTAYDPSASTSTSFRSNNTSNNPSSFSASLSAPLSPPSDISSTNHSNGGGGISTTITSGAGAGAGADPIAGAGTDFGFDSLREQMAAFMIKCDDFVDRRKKAVLAEKNEFQKAVEEVKEQKRTTTRQISLVQRTTESQQTLVQDQSAETEDLKESIRQLEEERDAGVHRRDALLSQISHMRARIATGTASRRANATVRNNQARQNLPELGFWERYLGMRIESGGEVDRLRFVFGCVSEGGGGNGGGNGGRDSDGHGREDDEDDNDELLDSSEVWFELGTGERDYKVLRYEPRNGIDPADVRACVDKLNDTRDLAPFLKGMRQLFVAAIRDK